MPTLTPRFPASARGRASIAALALIAEACTQWRAGALPSPDAPPGAAEGRNIRARVVLTDGRRVELRALAVRADSVVGYVGPTDEPLWRFSVPVSDVVAVERADVTTVRRTGNTIVGVYGALAVVGVFAAFFVMWSAVH